MTARKPVGEVEDDARKESGLSDAQQEAHDREARRTRNHRGKARQDPPGDHDPGDPYSGADLFQDHVARDLEDEIAPVKHADGKPEGAGRHTEVAAHGEACEAHIDPIDIGEHIRQDRKRKQPQIDLAHGRSLERTVHCFPPFMASRAYAVFEIEGAERLPSIQKSLESCGAKHGTALLSHQTSVGLTPHPDQCPSQSHWPLTIKRFARTSARFVVLAGNLVREEDQPS